MGFSYSKSPLYRKFYRSNAEVRVRNENTGNTDMKIQKSGAIQDIGKQDFKTWSSENSFNPRPCWTVGLPDKWGKQKVSG